MDSSSSKSDADSAPPQKRHVVLFPFMAKGHIIPLLHLARLLLLRRHISVTFFTTAANRPFIADSLSDTSAAVVSLPFPYNLPGIPAEVESTDRLPSMSLFTPFAEATELLKPHFEQALQNLLPRVSLLVSDGFLWWTLDSAANFGIPRLVSYGMPTYAMVLTRLAIHHGLLHGNNGEDFITAVPPLPGIKIRRKDFDTASSVSHEFMAKVTEATSRSFGIVVNSSYEMERDFVDFFNREYQCKAWCVGPLCLAEKKQLQRTNKHPWIHQWLDLQKGSVLYVAFGSQAEISPQQIKEIAKGLEESEVNFVWVMRKRDQTVDEYLPEGYEERVRNRGIVVREWVEQMEILKHESVKGFMSHCGWNSVMESVCAEVPILAWPMTAEQPMNARMVAEEMKVGLRVEKNCDGFVEREEVKKKVKELMEGETGKEVRKKVKEVADMARKAVAEGGSSSQALDKLIKETCG